MSKRIYLLFSQIHNIKPKLLKSQRCVQKSIAENPSYKFKEYQSEGIAKNVLQVYEIEYKKHLLNLKKDKVDQRIQQLVKEKEAGGVDNMISDNSQPKGNNSNNSNNSQQPITTPPLTPTLTPPKQQQSGILKPQPLQHLLALTQPLLTLTPHMQTILQPFTPTPLLRPISQQSVITGYFDGCSKFNPGPASVGYYMTHGQDLVFEACWALGSKTNNQAQFSALLFLLVNAYVNGIRRVRLFGDSRLVVDAVNGRARVSNVNIVDLYNCVEKMIGKFSYWKLEYVERQYNTRADKLSNMPLKTSKKRQEMNRIAIERQQQNKGAGKEVKEDKID